MWFLKERIDHIKGLTYLLLPKCIKKKIHNKFKKKKTQRYHTIFRNYPVSKQDVYDAFAKLDIHGDLFVHSSIVDIGNVRGGNKPFTECLDKYVLDRGNTLLLTAIPIQGSSREFLQSIKSFDKNAPIGMGTITTHYSLNEGAKRSLEPTHSVIAVGPKADYYTNDHHLDTTPFGTHSPYYKLYKNHGQVIMIGCGLKFLTILHLVEDLLGDLYPFKVYTKESYRINIMENDRVKCVGEYKAHNSLMGSLRSHDYILQKIMELESTQIVPIGASRIILLDAVDVINCYLKELKSGHSAYGHCRCSKACKNRIDELLQNN